MRFLPCLGYYNDNDCITFGTVQFFPIGFQQKTGSSVHHMVMTQGFIIQQEPDVIKNKAVLYWIISLFALVVICIYWNSERLLEKWLKLICHWQITFLHHLLLWFFKVETMTFNFIQEKKYSQLVSVSLAELETNFNMVCHHLYCAATLHFVGWRNIHEQTYTSGRSYW